MDRSTAPRDEDPSLGNVNMNQTRRRPPALSFAESQGGAQPPQPQVRRQAIPSRGVDRHESSQRQLLTARHGQVDHLTAGAKRPAAGPSASGSKSAPAATPAAAAHTAGSELNEKLRRHTQSLKTRFWDGLEDPANTPAAPKSDPADAARRDLARGAYHEHRVFADRDARVQSKISALHRSAEAPSAASASAARQKNARNQRGELVSMGTFMAGGLVLSGAAYMADRFTRGAAEFNKTKFADYPNLQADPQFSNVMTALEPFFVISPRKAESLCVNLDTLILIWRKATAYEHDHRLWMQNYNRYDKKQRDILDRALTQSHREDKKRAAASGRALEAVDGGTASVMSEEATRHYASLMARYCEFNPPPTPLSLWRDTANLAYMNIREAINDYAHMVMAFNMFWSACGKLIMLDPVVGDTSYQIIEIKTRIADRVIRTGDLPQRPMDVENFTDSARSRALCAAGKEPVDPRLRHKAPGHSALTTEAQVRQYEKELAEYESRLARFTFKFREHFQWWMTTFVRTLPTMRYTAYKLGLDDLAQQASATEARRNARRKYRARQAETSGDGAASSKADDESDEDDEDDDSEARQFPFAGGWRDKAGWLASQVLGQSGRDIVTALMGRDDDGNPKRRPDGSDGDGDGGAGEDGGDDANGDPDGAGFRQVARRRKYGQVNIASPISEKLRHAYSRVRDDGLVTWLNDPYAFYEHQGAMLPVDTLNFAHMDHHFKSLINAARALKQAVITIIHQSDRRMARVFSPDSVPPVSAGNAPTDYSERLQDLEEYMTYDDPDAQDDHDDVDIDLT